MNTTRQPFNSRKLLATSLLIAAVIAAVIVWLDRQAPMATALSNLSGPDVHGLVSRQHTEGDREICGMALHADIEAIRSVPHGLDSTSELPAEAIAELEFHGASPDDYEQRHFDTHRLLLISWDPTSRDLGAGYGAELGSVYELHYLEDETSIGWGTVYSGTVYECRPEDLIE